MRLNKHYILYYLLLLAVLVGVLGGIYYLNRYFKAERIEPNSIGGERDNQGCLVAAGYSWCEQSQKCLRAWEEPCTKQDKINNIENIITNIERDTLIDFSESRNVSFEWEVTDKFGVSSTIVIDGLEFIAQDVDTYEQQAVDNYFLNTEFQIPKNKQGFVKNGIFCIVARINEGGVEGVNIKCGYAEEAVYEILYDDRAEAEIKKLLADKYNYELEKVIVEFSNKNTTHARGIVTYLPESPGNSGLFLAMKIDNTWRLVFDGNGSYSCEKIAPYNFPAEMIKECR